MASLISFSFALIGMLAVVVLLEGWRHLTESLAALHRELKRPPRRREIRVTVAESVLVRQRPNRGPLRHKHQSKPVRHRLHRKARRRTTA